MALVIDLKPKEKVIVGDVVITNDEQRTRLHISGDAPILREKDIMTEQELTSPCRNAYFIIQLMYLDKHPEQFHKQYFDIIHEIQDAAPSTSVYFMAINDHILAGNYYKALKDAKKLIQYEQDLISMAMGEQPAEISGLRKQEKVETSIEKNMSPKKGTKRETENRESGTAKSPKKQEA